MTEIPKEVLGLPGETIEQAYLCTRPVLRVRRRGDSYVFTCKGTGLLAREEYELPLDAQSYELLRGKAEGTPIRKVRRCIPLGELQIELDVFEAPFAPLVVAEVEFQTREQAMAFQPPAWFGREVTFDSAYSNASLSQAGAPPLCK